jgi:hypothetical protein
VENTEKYQRASIKTISFTQDNVTIQGSYLIDQRSNTTVELGYTVTTNDVTAPYALPTPTPTVILTSNESIAEVTQTNDAIIKTLSVVQMVDFSLANSTPTFIEIKNYTDSATITLVYETPTSNSRILCYFNTVSQ